MVNIDFGQLSSRPLQGLTTAVTMQDAGLSLGAKRRKSRLDQLIDSATESYINNPSEEGFNKLAAYNPEAANAISYGAQRNLSAQEKMMKQSIIQNYLNDPSKRNLSALAALEGNVNTLAALEGIPTGAGIENQLFRTFANQYTQNGMSQQEANMMAAQELLGSRGRFKVDETGRTVEQTLVGSPRPASFNPPMQALQQSQQNTIQETPMDQYSGANPIVDAQLGAKVSPELNDDQTTSFLMNDKNLRSSTAKQEEEAIASDIRTFLNGDAEKGKPSLEAKVNSADSTFANFVSNVANPISEGVDFGSLTELEASVEGVLQSLGLNPDDKQYQDKVKAIRQMNQNFSDYVKGFAGDAGAKAIDSNAEKEFLKLAFPNANDPNSQMLQTQYNLAKTGFIMNKTQQFKDEYVEKHGSEYAGSSKYGNVKRYVDSKINDISKTGLYKDPEFLEYMSSMGAPIPIYSYSEEDPGDDRSLEIFNSAPMGAKFIVNVMQKPGGKQIGMATVVKNTDKPIPKGSDISEFVTEKFAKEY